MSKRVVIIDDSLFVRKQLRDFFTKKLGWQIVAEGANGREAITLWEEHKPDLMTLDIVMEIMDGTQAIKEIMSRFPDAVILMVSAVRTGEMLDCISYGAKEYMEKPLRFKDEDYIEDFKKTLEEVFEEPITYLS